MGNIDRRFLRFLSWILLGIPRNGWDGGGQEQFFKKKDLAENRAKEAQVVLKNILTTFYNEPSIEYHERMEYGNITDLPREFYGRIYSTMTRMKKRFYFFGKLVPYKVEENLVEIKLIGPPRFDGFAVTFSEKVDSLRRELIIEMFHEQGFEITSKF